VGSFPLVKKPKTVLGERVLEKVISHALEHGNVVGGWQNTENRKYYFDSNTVFTDKDEAIRFGKENRKIAIFDLDSLTEIRL